MGNAVSVAVVQTEVAGPSGRAWKLSFHAPPGLLLRKMRVTPRHRTLCRRRGHVSPLTATALVSAPEGGWHRVCASACSRCGSPVLTVQPVEHTFIP